MTTRNISLSDQQYALLKKLAARTGLSVSELIRRAVDEYVARTAKIKK